jgi:hypothetical protein
VAITIMTKASYGTLPSHTQRELIAEIGKRSLAA